MSHISSRLLVLLALALLAGTAQAGFGFSYSKATQCDDLTITWSGGTPPFQLLMIPKFSAPRNISVPASAFDTSSNTGHFTTTLAIKTQTVFVMTMSDATGFGAGGTTALLTVGASVSNNNCDTSDPNLPFTFQLNTALQQCRNYVISDYNAAVQPVTIRGVIPQGGSFTLNPPVGPTSFSWIADIAAGTDIILTLTDAKGNSGGSSDVLAVGSSNDSSCLNGSSPASTSGSPQSNTASSTATSTTTSPSASQTSPPHKKSSNAAAIGGGIAAGVVALLILASLLVFCLKKRRAENRRASGTIEGAGMKQKHTRRMRSIDLIPEPDRHAHYPLNAGGNGANGSSTNLPNEYEPVPYVLPPAPAARSEYGDDRTNDSFADGNGARTRTTSYGSTAALSKAQMMAASRSSADGRGYQPNAPARFVMHTDAGSVADHDDDGDEEEGEEEIVELPPQYDTLTGAALPRQTSRRRSQRRPNATTSEAVPTNSSAGPSHPPVPPVPPPTST